MCVTSAAIDSWTSPGSPNYLTFAQSEPAPATAFQILEVIRLLELIDKRLGALECKIEEKKKREFKRKLRKRARGGK